MGPGGAWLGQGPVVFGAGSFWGCVKQDLDGLMCCELMALREKRWTP